MIGVGNALAIALASIGMACVAFDVAGMLSQAGIPTVSERIRATWLKWPAAAAFGYLAVKHFLGK